MVVVFLRRAIHHLPIGRLPRPAGDLQEARHLELEFALVGGLVELVEEEEEHDGVHADPPDKGARVVAVDE